jgi:carbon monoxide dehydrogenase subunit G
MAFVVEERFQVRAPADAVWAWLVDPRCVVTCLPGAELLEVVDDRAFAGAVRVRVGPMEVAYRGRVLLGEVDEAARRVCMTAEGRESGGAGTARMSMTCELAPQAAGGTEVSVRAEIDVAGRLVQLGRGMFEQVSHQLFQEFAGRAREALEAGPAGAEGRAGPSAPRPVRLVPLLLRAAWASLLALLRRLLGPRR